MAISKKRTVKWETSPRSSKILIFSVDVSTSRGL